MRPTDQAPTRSRESIHGSAATRAIDQTIFVMKRTLKVKYDNPILGEAKAKYPRTARDVVQLPMELWDGVFFFLRPHFSTLVTCASVSSMWRQVALGHIMFYTVGYGAFSRLPQMLYFFRERCPRIRTLKLDGCVRLVDEMLREFPRCLRELSLRECRTITNRGMRLLRESCPFLEVLDISQPSPSRSRWLGPKITDMGLEYLPRALLKLVLWPCEDSITGEGFRALTSLETLICASYELQAEYLPPSLKYLKTQVDFFGSLPAGLHTLNIRRCMRSRALEFSEQLPSSLRVLAIQFHQLEDNSGMRLPAGLQELRLSNSLDACRYVPFLIRVPSSTVRLYVHCPGLLDEEAAAMISPQLEMLSLSCCAVTNNILRALPSTLTHLRLDNVEKINDEGIFLFNKRQPGVHFTFKRCANLNSTTVARLLTVEPDFRITLLSS